MRKGMIVIMAVSCAGCVSAVSEGFDNAPEWFEERREELAGSGYPDLKTAKNLEVAAENAPWDAIEKDITIAVRQMKANDPGPVTFTEEDMRAWAAKQRALVAKGEEPY